MALPERSESELMRLIAQGDRVAFTQLMQHHLTALVLFCRQYLPQEADDIAQECFIRLWRTAPDWQDQGISVKAWLFKVGYRLCMDALRKHKPLELDETDESLLKDNVLPLERQLAAQQELAEHYRLLQDLPERQRSAIILTAWHGLKNVETARIMDISTDALESLLRRGRQKLQNLFEQSTGLSREEEVCDEN